MIVKTWVRKELENLRTREGGDEYRWVLTLDEYDEPPMFTRLAQIEFLRKLSLRERCLAVLEFSLEDLERIVDALAEHPEKGPSFACLTLMNWDLVRAGRQLVVTPAFLVSPRPADELRRFRIRRACTADALEALSWLRALRRREFVVAESDTAVDDELRRVYIGFRHRKAEHVWTITDYLRPTAET